jgi:hypothetical protein
VDVLSYTWWGALPILHASVVVVLLCGWGALPIWDASVVVVLLCRLGALPILDVKHGGCVVMHVMGSAPHLGHLCSRCITLPIGSALYLRRQTWWMFCNARDGERSLSQMSNIVNVLSWTWWGVLPASDVKHGECAFLHPMGSAPYLKVNVLFCMWWGALSTCAVKHGECVVLHLMGSALHLADVAYSHSLSVWIGCTPYPSRFAFG